MSTSQCAVYQVKDTPEYRDVRFRSFSQSKVLPIPDFPLIQPGTKSKERKEHGLHRITS